MPIPPTTAMPPEAEEALTPKVSKAYTPAEHFVEAEKLPPVVPGAIDDDTELWLIRLPGNNELVQADLLSKRVKLKVDAPEGKIGHFANEKGQEYNIIKHKDSELLQPYAIIPNGDGPFKVRKITCQLRCVKSWDAPRAKESKRRTSVEPNQDASGSRHDPESDVSSGRHRGVESESQKRHHKSKRRKSE